MMPCSADWSAAGPLSMVVMGSTVTWTPSSSSSRASGTGPAIRISYPIAVTAHLPVSKGRSGPTLGVLVMERIHGTVDRASPTWCKASLRSRTDPIRDGNRIEEPHRSGPLDGLMSGRRTELAIHRKCLGLDGVPGNRQQHAHFDKGQVGGQKMQNPALGGRERRESKGGICRQGVECGLEGRDQ